jgi:hypothetical protein
MDNLTDRERNLLRCLVDNLLYGAPDDMSVPDDQLATGNDVRETRSPNKGGIVKTVAEGSLTTVQRKFVAQELERMAHFCLEKSILVAGEGSTGFRNQVSGTIASAQCYLDLALEKRERKQ